MNRPSPVSYLTPSNLEARSLELSQEFAKRAGEHDQDGSFPFENIAALCSAGLLGLAIPKTRGGGGAGLQTCRRVINAIAQGEPSTALVLAQQYLFQNAMFLSDGWNADLRDEIAASMIKDGALANMLRVEPVLGTPVRGGLPATVAARSATGWTLNGHKIFSTGIPALRWLGIWARTDEPEPRAGIWIVPRGARGLTIKETWDHLGMRATRSDDLLLENVQVPERNTAELRATHAGALPNEVQSIWTAILFTTVYDGVARAARDWIVQFLKDRVPSNLGKPLASLPRMQEAIGAIDALLFANRVLLDSVAERIDAGIPVPRHEGFFAKFIVTRNAIEAVEKAVEISGNPGLSRANPLERHLRDVLCARIHSPQNDTILIEGGRRGLDFGNES